MKILFPIAIALLACCASGCATKSTKEKEAPEYPTLTVDLTDRTLMSDYAASVTGRQTVEIRPQIDGLLTDILVRDGAPVSIGQVLFEIDPAQFQAAYDIAEANVLSAEAAVSTAQLVLDSNTELYQEEVISEFELNTAKNELAEAQAKLKLAKAELEKAATNLSYTQVKSPVNGVASMIPYRVGALVGPNITSPLVTVSDDNEVYAYFSMSENSLLDLISQYGSRSSAMEKMPEVEFRMSNGDLYPHKGRIDAVSGTINNSTGAVTFRAVFPNPDRWLRDGGTGSVIIPQTYEQCIVIPQSATYELQDRKFVYKVIDGKASSAEVTVLPQSNGKEYLVTSGLEEGDVIVSEGAGLIKEGTVVNPKAKPEAEAETAEADQTKSEQS
ncbi:MAG: efflux RND transporter periplasmic adaptor subunit [Bacteroidales bacterium]|nr:efflux RND transporter periplasmic adaptor subunit [Bacteroidales bacterium]